ncbi:hypothetical protein BHM03_00011064 [Ensete ventricosum]|nr:hypothetical protein BHM03_00011064 [Ensete ventricosum]
MAQKLKLSNTSLLRFMTTPFLDAWSGSLTLLPHLGAMMTAPSYVDQETEIHASHIVYDDSTKPPNDIGPSRSSEIQLQAALPPLGNGSSPMILMRFHQNQRL